MFHRGVKPKHILFLLSCFSLTSQAALIDFIDEPPDKVLEDFKDIPDDLFDSRKVPPKNISLNEAVLLSLRLNPLVQSAELQRVVDKFGVAVAYNQFEFKYALAANVNLGQSISGGSPLNNSRAFSVTPAISKLSAYGTQYGITMNNPVNYANPNYLYAPSLNLAVSHPLLKGSGRSVVQAGLNLALIGNEVAKLNYKNAVMGQINTVIRDYYAVVGAENALMVDQQALAAAEETVRQNYVRIKIGFMAPSENVQAEASVASQKLQIASDLNAIQLSKLQLLTDIGLPIGTNIQVDKKISSSGKSWPKGKEAAKILFSNNIGWLTLLFGLKSSKLGLLLAEDQQRWTLNLEGSVVQGAGSGIGENGGIPSISNGLNRSRSVGLSLVVPIDDLSIQSAIVSAKVGYTQFKLSMKQSKLALQSQLLGSIENLEILSKQIELAKNAVILANQSYLDAYKKATFGQASMFEVTTLQTNLISVQIQQISTEIGFLNSLADYQLFLGITLDVWNIKLRY